MTKPLCNICMRYMSEHEYGKPCLTSSLFDGDSLITHNRYDKDYWRYEFAKACLTGIYGETEIDEYYTKRIAKTCGEQADAMIDWLEKNPREGKK